MAANQRANSKPKKRPGPAKRTGAKRPMAKDAAAKRPAWRPWRPAEVPHGDLCHHTQATSVISGEFPETAGGVAIIYGGESQPWARIFPVLAAEKVDDEEVWRPSRLGRQPKETDTETALANIDE